MPMHYEQLGQQQTYQDPEDALKKKHGTYRDDVHLLTPEQKYANLAMPGGPDPQPFANLSNPVGPGRNPY